MKPLVGIEREWAISVLKQHHYAHSVSSAKSYYFHYEEAIVCFSIPANKNIAQFLLGERLPVWELSRLWAPDGHRSNLLSQAISVTSRAMSRLEPSAQALVSYADPNVGHRGSVYRAASWNFLGQCEEARYYRLGDQVVARRKFHSGSRALRKAEILALGYTEERLPGKYRFARGLTRFARGRIAERAKEFAT